MTWRRWRRRIVARRPALRPPAPSPSGLEEARQAAREAAELHQRALELGPVVEERAARAERIHRENHLGPSFWKAMGGREPGHA